MRITLLSVLKKINASPFLPGSLVPAKNGEVLKIVGVISNPAAQKRRSNGRRVLMNRDVFHFVPSAYDAPAPLGKGPIFSSVPATPVERRREHRGKDEKPEDKGKEA